MSDHPAVAYLRNAHERAEELARAAMKPAPDLYPSDPIEFIIANNDLNTREITAAEAHIRANTPAAVLRRVETERTILDEHRPYQEIHLGPLCFTCVGVDTYRSGVAIHQFFPCNVVVGLAKAWGWEA